MSRQPRVVAHLGRPETPEETAARKAEFSAAYRSSQTFRNLIAALIVTLAVVAVIIFAVPRGERVETPAIDLPGTAATVHDYLQRPIIVPEVRDDWQVNRAELVDGPTAVWDVILAPSAETARGFVHVAQALNADASWAPFVLSGTAPTGTVRAGGIEWDEYTLRNPAQSGNVSYALGTQAGSDYILVYGALSPDETAELAASLAPQINAIVEAE